MTFVTKNAFFDGLSNTNVLGIPADGTADKEFCFVVLGSISENLLFVLRLKCIYNILIYQLTLTR